MDEIKTLNEEHKEIIPTGKYLTREEILDIYPINNTTYNNKLKLLVDHPTDCQLSFIKNKKRYVEESIIHKYFFPQRVPSETHPKQVEKWINLVDWKYFCCISPTSNDIDENIQFIKNINKVLKKTFGLENSILFYSIGLYKETEYFDIKLLFDFGKEIPIELITKTISQTPLIKKVVKKGLGKNRFSKPILTQKYDWDRFGSKGINYTLKMSLRSGVLK